jgi:hypothetical protein
MASAMGQATGVWARASLVGEYAGTRRQLGEQLRACLDGVTLWWTAVDAAQVEGCADARLLLKVKGVAEVRPVERALVQGVGGDLTVGVEALEEDSSGWSWMWQMEADLHLGGGAFCSQNALLG